MSEIKFRRCNKLTLQTIPVADGQLIYTKDTGECYIDVNETRIRVIDKDLTDTVTNLESTVEQYKTSLESSISDNLSKINANTQEIETLSNKVTTLENNILTMEAMHSFDDYPTLVTNGTTAQLFESVKSLNLKVGAILLGGTELTDINDVAPGMTNEEMKIEVYPNDVFHATMTSTNISPYEWTIQYHNGIGTWIPRVIN